MLGFSLARISYLNISGSSASSFANNAAIGEWYWYRQDLYRIGISIHLGTILPAGILMVWQFIPIIRHQFLLFHRINGSIIIILVFVSNIGALMICRRAFGGALETQTAVGLLAIATYISLGLAYYNVKRLQIDQHRAWMLRAVFYLGTIITQRIIMVLSAIVISTSGNYNTTMSCSELEFINRNNITANAIYSVCNGQNITTANSLAIVHADLHSDRSEQVAAGLRITFGMAFWLAIAMHAVGVEVYLALTPRENNRLRQVSYERQLERGFSRPGSAGLTSDRCGDADRWTPKHTGSAIGMIQM